MSDFLPSREAAELMRRQFEIDYEDAGPKTIFTQMAHKGIRLESRWDVAHEYEAMRRAIDLLRDAVARRLLWIWCDSNCSANYVVGFSEYEPDFDEEIDAAFCRANGGHNGIALETGESPFAGERVADLIPRWSFDEAGEAYLEEPLARFRSPNSEAKRL